MESGNLQSAQPQSENSTPGLMVGRISKSRAGRPSNMATHIDAVIEPADTRKWILRGLNSALTCQPGNSRTASSTHGKKRPIHQLNTL